jgi:hypothetical protein
MANANAPQGLRPVRDGSNRPYSGGGNTYWINTAANNFFVGDPVTVAGTADANGVPGVVIATAGATNYITGAILGFVPDPTIVATGYAPTGWTGYVIVEDDPNVTYEVQSTTLAAADLEANSILASGTGSRISGSGWYMDTGTKGTSNTYQLRITGVSQSPDNALGQYCKALVRINLPTEAGLPTGTGF